MKPPPIAMVFDPGGPARDVVSKLAKGGRLLVVSRGQFSLLDMIHAVLERTGPASVMFTSWSTGMNDAKQMAWLLQEGHIRALRVFSGNGFADRHPEYVAQMRTLFGDDCVVTADLHCKIAVIVNAEWSVCVRSSCNLNRNPRIEQFDVDDNRDMAEWLISWSEQLAAKGAAGWIPDDREVARTRMREWGGLWEERPAHMPIARRSEPPPPPGPEGETERERSLRLHLVAIEADLVKVRADGRDPGRLLEEVRIASREYAAAVDECRAIRDGETERDRVRRYLRYAIEVGSMGAAVSLEKRIVQIERAEREAEEAKRRGLSTNKIEALADAIRRLPKPAQLQIVAMLTDTDAVEAH